MATIEDVARLSVAALDSEVDYLLALEWARERYKELVAKVRFRHLRRMGQLSIPAEIAAGTIDVTHGSTTVVGDGTAIAAWSPLTVGYWLKVGHVSQWYKVTALSQGELRLSVPYVGTTASDQGYRLVKRFHTLTPEARHLEDVIYMRRRWLLDPMAVDTLNSLAPARSRIGSAPWVWAEVGVDLDAEGKSCRLIEVYPYLKNADILHYTWWPDPPTLGQAEPLPKGIDEYVLREGVLVDLMRSMMAKAEKDGRIDAAALWRNEYRAQQTVWEHKIRDAIKNDRGFDDLTGTLERPKYELRDLDITDAFGQVWGHR